MSVENRQFFPRLVTSHSSECLRNEQFPLTEHYINTNTKHVDEMFIIIVHELYALIETRQTGLVGRPSCVQA